MVRYGPVRNGQSRIVLAPNWHRTELLDASRPFHGLHCCERPKTVGFGADINSKNRAVWWGAVHKLPVSLSRGIVAFHFG